MNDTACEKPESEKKFSLRGKFGWMILFVVIAVASIYAITSLNKQFSFRLFLEFLQNASPYWMAAAFVSMFGFILFEALAVLTICRAFGYRRSLRSGFIYSASDIYFSAITPSASGGQPACGYFMFKDGIPATVITFSLLLNLILYILAILFIGTLSFVFFPGRFLAFGTFSQVLIIAGLLVQAALAILFYLLLRREKFVHRIGAFAIRLLGKLHLVKDTDKLQTRLDNAIVEYKSCSTMLKGQRKVLLLGFLWNFLQRFSQIAVTLFTFLATGGSAKDVGDILAIQSYAVLGSNCLPIPGSIGVTDYLMLDGFSSLLSAQDATNLELLSRSVSFYTCIILCGVAVLVKYACQKMRGKSS